MSRLYYPAKAIEVILDDHGLPATVMWRGGIYLGKVCSRWRIETGWWEQAVARDYYLFESEDLVCEVYRDIYGDSWFMHRIYD